MMWELLLSIAELAFAFYLGRSIGRTQGRDEATSTVIIVNLDGKRVGAVRIDGVLVVPNASHLDLPPPA